MNKKEYKELQKSGEIELAAMKFIEENNNIITICDLFKYLCKINKYTIPYLFNYYIDDENNVVIKRIYQNGKIKTQSSIFNIISDNRLRLNILKVNDIKSVLQIAGILIEYIYHDLTKEIYISSSLDKNYSIYISFNDCADIKTNKYLCDNINIYILYSKEENLFGIGLFYFPDPINNPTGKELIFAKPLGSLNLISNKDMSIYNPKFIDNSFIITDDIDDCFI